MRYLWRPIETAPKDGTEILLLCPEEGVYVGRWMDKKPETMRGAYSKFNEHYNETGFEPKLLTYFGCGKCCADAFPPEPTHWAPLPKEKIGDQEG